MIDRKQMARAVFRSAVQMWVDDLLDLYSTVPVDAKTRRMIGQEVKSEVEEHLHRSLLLRLEEHEKARQEPFRRRQPEPCDVISFAEAAARRMSEGS